MQKIPHVNHFSFLSSHTAHQRGTAQGRLCVSHRLPVKKDFSVLAELPLYVVHFVRSYWYMKRLKQGTHLDLTPQLPRFCKKEKKRKAQLILWICKEDKNKLLNVL